MRKNDYEITYRNDYVFKSTLKGDDDDSKFILKFLIEAVTGREYKEIEVMNSELLGEYINSKNSYLDIKAIDMEGNIINIEMQQSYLNALQRKRIQYYGCRSITIQPIKGERYDKLNKVEQIVFTSKRYNEKLYTKFTLREENGKEMKDNLITYHIISLPFIEEIFKEKNKKNIPLDDLEVLSYAYYFMIDSGIMNIVDEKQKKVLEIMVKKRDYILEDQTTYDIAKAIAYAEASQDADLMTAHEIGIKEGYENGLKIGFKDGKEAGFKEMLQNFIRVKLNESIDLSNISKNQLDRLKENIFMIETKEQLDEILEER